jgi:hypothetical protein
MTITYETAKKLKELGFNQNLEREDEREGSWYTDYGVLDEFHWSQPGYYVPTLSELIDACGKDFMLTNECGKWEAWSGSNSDFVRMGEGGAEFQCEAEEPEEAVALLWIQINTK